MSDIKVGSVWVAKLDRDRLVTVSRTMPENNALQYTRGTWRTTLSVSDFISEFELIKNPCLDDSQKPKHSHYHKDVSQYDTIDIYVICDLYVNDNSGCIQHAVKKLLCCGNRGVKDNVKDLQEAIDTIQRKIEILQGKPND